MTHRFNRFELKYVLRAAQVGPLLQDIAPFMAPDSHAGASGFYRVVSLYYDGPGFPLYHDKIDGVSMRRKLRLRVYPRGSAGDVREAMVEIKQRVDRTVQKRRIVLDPGRAKDLCAGRLDPFELDPNDRGTADEVRTMTALYRLAPALVVSYLRRALVGTRYDPALRVTVDSDVSARVHALDVTLSAVNHRIFPADVCILEVKVDERMPGWLASVLAAHDLSIRRVSKYCAGIERCAGLRARELEAMHSWTNF